VLALAVTFLPRDAMHGAAYYCDTMSVCGALIGTRNSSVE